MSDSIFSHYPDSWAATEFSEIVKDIQKVNPKEKPYESFIYIDIASIDNKKYKITNPKFYLGKDAPSRARQLIKSGDIVFSTVRTYLKNMALVDEKYHGQIASTGFCVIRSNLVNNKLLFYLLQFDSFLNPVNKIQRGTSYPAIRNSDLLEQKIAIPPLNEQNRIVSKIEELFTKLDAGIQELTLAKEKLKIYRQSVLKYAFQGKLTEGWRQTNKNEIKPVILDIEKIKNDRKKKLGRKYKKYSPIDSSKLKKLPKSWVWERLVVIADITMGQSPPGKSYNKEGIGTPLINGPVEFGPNPFSKTIKSKFTTSPNKMCKKNDLILCVRGSTTGRMNISGFNACIGRGVASLQSYFFQPYLDFFIHSIQKDIFDSGTGSTFPNVTLTTLNNILVPIPSLIEQKEIVKEIDFNFTIIDAIMSNIDENIIKSYKLRQSILRKAFNGQLVSQYRNDEPAEKLLERIKAEKEKQETKVNPMKKVKTKSKQKRLL